MPKQQTVNVLSWALALIIALLATRLLTLGLYPLYDTTEARYGEMARIMLETQNWITPQFDYGVPFWGKPPFQTWISAISFLWFGVNEFSARLPHFLCGIITLALIYRFANKVSGRYSAIYACLVMASSLGFIIASGMVMTDVALLMSITLAMVSFWQSYRTQSRRDGHLFFVALALGLLIKGPVAIVLIGIALVSWSLWQRCFVTAIKSLPWFTGIPLMLLIALPWYIVAEIKSPGFLEYFIVGEHIQRFIVSGWQGDLYGTAHVETKGTIWLFWLASAFPWSFVIIAMLIKRKRSQTKITKSRHEGLSRYLICWMIAPMLLFTVAGNILPAYVLPGFSAMAVLIAINSQLSRRTLGLAFTTYILLITILFVFISGLSKKVAESALLEDQYQSSGQSPLYYWKARPFSAQFYSKGQAKLLDNEPQLIQLLRSQRAFFLAIAHTDHSELIAELGDCKQLNQTKSRLLLKCHWGNK